MRDVGIIILGTIYVILLIAVGRYVWSTSVTTSPEVLITLIICATIIFLGLITAVLTSERLSNSFTRLQEQKNRESAQLKEQREKDKEAQNKHFTELIAKEKEAREKAIKELLVPDLQKRLDNWFKIAEATRTTIEEYKDDKLIKKSVQPHADTWDDLKSLRMLLFEDQTTVLKKLEEVEQKISLVTDENS